MSRTAEIYAPDSAEMSIRELKFRTATWRERRRLLEKGHSNKVHLLIGSDDQLYVFKPEAGEQLGQRLGIPTMPGEYAKREVAAYRADQQLGFGLVPTTTFVHPPRRNGTRLSAEICRQHCGRSCSILS